MTGKKLTLWATGGAALTALFTWINSGPSEHEGVQLSEDSKARIHADASFSLFGAASGAAHGSEAPAPHQSSLTQTVNTEAQNGLHAVSIADAKRYYTNYNLAQDPTQKFAALLSAFEAMKSDPANARHLGLTPQGLVAIIRNEAQMTASSLSSVVGLKVDGEFPNTEDMYRLTQMLEKAERYISLREDGSTSPDSSWGQIITPQGTALTRDIVQNYQREIGINLAKNYLANYRSLAATNDTAYSSQMLAYLEGVQTYGSRAWLGSGSRDIWKEIGIPKGQLDQLVDRLKNPPQEQGQTPPGP